MTTVLSLKMSIITYFLLNLRKIQNLCHELAYPKYIFAENLMIW